MAGGQAGPKVPHSNSERLFLMVHPRDSLVRCPRSGQAFSYGVVFAFCAGTLGY